MVQTILEYMEDRMVEGVVMVHNIENEDTDTPIKLLKEIYFNKCCVTKDEEVIELKFDNTEVMEILIDDICDVSVIFDELIVILEYCTRITITY